MARPEGVEPPTFGSVVRRSIQLSYGRSNCIVEYNNISKIEENAINSGQLKGNSMYIILNILTVMKKLLVKNMP